MEGREVTAGEKDENVVLEFRPNPPHEMLVAYLWWKLAAAIRRPALGLESFGDRQKRQELAALAGPLRKHVS
jgi:hypothetical protein